MVLMDYRDIGKPGLTLDVVEASAVLPSTLLCPHFHFSIYFLMEEIRSDFHGNIILC